MDGYVVINTELNTKSFDRKIEQLENQLEGLIQEYDILSEDSTWNTQSEDAIKLRSKIEQVNNQLVDMRKKQLDLVDGSKQLDDSAKNYNTNIGSVFTKIGKMGLAIFGIQSAYRMILSSANQLASQNDIIAGKMDVIKNSLTNLLAPAVEVIINLVYKLLSYLNVITKTFLGIDLFKKSAKSAKSTVGSAKKLQKTLASFDEMNILNGNTPSSGGGGGGGTKAPEPIDTGDFQETVEKYKKMWEDLLDINRSEMAQMILEQDSTWGLLKLGWFDTIQGIAYIVTGFVDTFKGIGQILVGIANGDTKKIKEGVTTLFTGITEMLRGLVQTVLGLVEMLVGLIWGVLKSLALWIYDNVIKPIWKFIKSFGDTVLSFVGLKLTAIKGLLTAMKGIIIAPFKTGFETVKTMLSKFVEAFKKSISGVKKLFSGDLKGALEDFKSAFGKVMSGLWTIAKAPLNLIIEGVNSLIRGVNKISFEVPDWVPSIGGKKWGFNIKQIPKLAKGGIVNLPSQGVPVGGAITGERGAEGVIPLTDSQQMELLGEAIGRYITINANITNNMNGRVISRELQKIQQESNFASNR